LLQYREAINVVAHVEGVADEREGEQRQRAEGKDGGDGGGGVTAKLQHHQAQVQIRAEGRPS
jgi:hypothetical protein